MITNTKSLFCTQTFKLQQLNHYLVTYSIPKGFFKRIESCSLVIVSELIQCEIWYIYQSRPLSHLSLSHRRAESFAYKRGSLSSTLKKVKRKTTNCVNGSFEGLDNMIARMKSEFKMYSEIMSSNQIFQINKEWNRYTKM